MYIIAEEIDRLHSHLALLREEYAKLQAKLVDAERRADVAEAATGAATDSFAARLLIAAADVFEKDLFRFASCVFSWGHAGRWEGGGGCTSTGKKRRWRPS